MIIPDSNLLLFAYNATSPAHQHAKTWWESCLSGSEPVGLCYPVLFSFVRIGTSSRAFRNPLTLDGAIAEIDAWLACRVTRILLDGPGHFATVAELLRAAGSTGGNLVTDAQIAAYAKAAKGTIHTDDRDFARFREISVVYPLDDASSSRTVDV